LLVLLVEPGQVPLAPLADRLLLPADVVAGRIRQRMDGLTLGEALAPPA
jgi:hypothetical protein